MNKDLVNELVKVANSLDNMGLAKEANSLDKIARKIVVSENQSLYDVDSEDDAKKLEQRTGKYSFDIWRYKSLYYAGYKQQASNLYNSVVNAWFNNPYSDLQKKLFKLQAERIRSDDNAGYIDINETGFKKGKQSLNEYLYKAKITDYDGKLLPEIKDKQTLRARWFKNFVPYFSDIFKDPSLDPTRSKQFTQTFNMLALGLPEFQPAVESKDV
jgi:hypothetical protein